MQVARTITMQSTEEMTLKNKIREAQQIINTLQTELSKCETADDLHLAVSITILPRDATTKEL